MTIWDWYIPELKRGNTLIAEQGNYEFILGYAKRQMTFLLGIYKDDRLISSCPINLVELWRVFDNLSFYPSSEKLKFVI